MGNNVTFVDIDPIKIEKLNKGVLEVTQLKVFMND